MNDPHVEALIYHVEHGADVNYEKAAPLEHDTPEFSLRVENGCARFEMKGHYATEEAAREVVSPFIRAWEVAVGLNEGPDEFALVFDIAKVVDRNPPSGIVLRADTGHLLISGHDIKLHRSRSAYPAPAPHLLVSPDVKSMYDRYTGHLQGKEPLASMAYFCVTVLLAGKRRDVAVKKYQISTPILRKLTRLVTKKGGREARKASGAISEFTPHDRIWIDATIKAIIRRAAEVAYDPRQKLPLITIADLPQLD
jgi:hypothetical protein